MQHREPASCAYRSLTWTRGSIGSSWPEMGETEARRPLCRSTSSGTDDLLCLGCKSELVPRSACICPDAHASDLRGTGGDKLPMDASRLRRRQQ